MLRALQLLQRAPVWAYLVVAALGLLLIGGAVGHAISPPSAKGEQVLATPTVAEEAAAAAELMPDVRGLDEDSARRVLADAGITAPATTSTTPYAGPTGLVVSQDPAPGEEVSAVALELSVAAPMPDLVGQSGDDAVTRLEGLGSVARLAHEVRPDVAPGTVLRTQPAAGETLGLVSTVVVASEGDGLSLADVPYADGSDCSRDSDNTTLAGQDVLRAVYCYPGDPADPAYVRYTVRTKVTYLQAVLGVDDEGDPGTATVRALVDGKEVGTWGIAVGTNETVRVDLRGAIRFRLEVVSPDENPPTVVFGDAIFVGLPHDLSALEDFG